jgi:chaperonin GroES
MSLRAIGNKVIIEPIPLPTKVGSGIIVAAPQYQQKPTQGRVVSVGPGKVNHLGVRIPTEISVGDVVNYGWIGAPEVEWDGKRYTIIGADEVVGVLS